MWMLYISTKLKIYVREGQINAHFMFFAYYFVYLIKLNFTFVDIEKYIGKNNSSHLKKLCVTDMVI